MSKSKLIIPQSNAEKAKAERLALRLKGSISNLYGVLRLAKKEGISVPDACRKSNRHSNYANTLMGFLLDAEKKNGIRVPEIMELERMREKLLSKSYQRSSKSTATTELPRNNVVGIEKAIAGMRHAVENKMSMLDASVAIGKSPSFLSMSVCTVDKMKATPEQRETLKNLHTEYKQLIANGEVKLKIGQKTQNTNRTQPKRKAFTKNAGRNTNALMNISDLEENVEYKYQLVTDRPLRKIQKTYPLEAMQPGHSFSVPATANETKAVKKAITMFAKKNPGTRFVQAKEGRELVIWRTE